MYKYSKQTNQFIQLPDVPSDAITVSDGIVVQARAAVSAMLPFVVIDENTISVAPTTNHQYDAITDSWYYWPYKYSASANTFWPIELLTSYNIPDDAIDVDEATYQSSIVARMDGLPYVVTSSTTVSVAPSTAHDWDAKKKTWVENTKKAAAIAAEEAQAQVNFAISAVRSALQAAIDKRAKDMGFSGGNALMLYAGFDNIYKDTAQTFGKWEAQVWSDANAYKVEVLAGNKPMIAPDVAVSMMPDYPSDTTK